VGIAAGRVWLLVRADEVHDLEMRKSFLECIPEHAEIMNLASAWGV
jgi:hypothetical protein